MRPHKNRRRKSRRNINYVIVLLLLLNAVMIVLIAIPGFRRYKERAQRLACDQALTSARDGLIIEYLAHWEEGTVQDAMETLEEVMPERENLCPAGGTVYLVRGENGVFDPICGMHDADVKQRTRLNASYVLDQLNEALPVARQKNGGKEPEFVELRLNSKPLTCVCMKKMPEFLRGTKLSLEYDGVVAFYGLTGQGLFPVQGMESGQIRFFVYAEPESSATWRPGRGWTGDAYE